MDYNVGDIVKLCQEQWRIIEKKLLFPQNLFFIEAINHEEGTVKLRGVEQTLLVSTILPVKIDGIEDRDIFYDPIIAAPTVLPGQEIPVFKRNTSEYYLDGLKNSFNDYGVSYYCQISTFGLKYVHQIQHNFPSIARELKINYNLKPLMQRPKHSFMVGKFCTVITANKFKERYSNDETTNKIYIDKNINESNTIAETCRREKFSYVLIAIGCG